MTVRITYRSEITLEGSTIEEIRQKFEGLDLDPDTMQDNAIVDYGFVEVVSAEDTDSYEDLTNEF